MRRLLAALAVGFGSFGLLGCAGNASYVYKNPDGSGGVIALKQAGSQADVKKLIEQHVGAGVEVEVNSIDPAYGQAAGGGFDPNKAATAKAEPGTMHYVYKKKAPSGAPGMAGAPATGMTGGIGQAGFNTQQPAVGSGVGAMGSSGMPATGAMGGSNFGTGGAVGPPPAMFPGQK